MLQAELKILGGKHQGKLISLNTKKFLVGREQDCHLRPNSDLVSRHHCVFSVDDFSVRLRDLGSTNGTAVNGENIRGEKILQAGDRVTIGKLELEVIIRQSAGKPLTTPTPSTISTVDLPPRVSTTVEIATQTDDVDTSYAMDTYTPLPTAEGQSMLPPDTAIIDAASQQMPYAQPAGMGYQPPSYPPMMPPGYPMPGGYMPPAYPQFAPPGYGQMPVYGQPMGYPMNYPQMMPQQGYPNVAVAAPVAAPEVPEAAPAAEAMAVRLPNPEETGAKPANPPAAAGAGGAKKEEKPSTTAADIIKQYMNRRT